MRTFSESLARLAELLPKVEIEAKWSNAISLHIGLPGERTHMICCGPNQESWQNAGALERLSDLVYEKTGWDCCGDRYLTDNTDSDHYGKFTLYIACTSDSESTADVYDRRDHAHAEALILAIEKHLEEK